MSNIAENLEIIRRRIAAAAESVGRHPDEVTLVAVSKTRTVDEIREAIAAGVRHLGENRVQEALAKWQALRGEASGLTWHLIGSLQTNKVGQALQFADLIHSLDRPDLAEALHRRAERLGRQVDCLLEVNVSGEASKHGLAPAAVLPFLREIGRWGTLRVLGLMTMAPLAAPGLAARPYFRRLRELAEAAREVPGVEMRWLSMGMSGDYEAAIMEGANLVRIGTAIFGTRDSAATHHG